MFGFRPGVVRARQPADDVPALHEDERPDRQTGVHLGPIEDKHAAQKLVHLAENLFDLCRDYSILTQSPHGGPCPWKQMNKCVGPCDGSIDLEAYRQLVAYSADGAGRPAGLRPRADAPHEAGGGGAAVRDRREDQGVRRAALAARQGPVPPRPAARGFSVRHAPARPARGDGQSVPHHARPDRADRRPHRRAEAHRRAAATDSRSSRTNGATRAAARRRPASNASASSPITSSSPRPRRAFSCRSRRSTRSRSPRRIATC